jgi:hypothetical protein
MFVSITRILPEMATPNPASYSNNSVRTVGFASTSLDISKIGLLDGEDFFMPRRLREGEKSDRLLELACNTASPKMLAALDAVKWDMLEEWGQTRKAPKQAAWMHDGRYKEMFQ